MSVRVPDRNESKVEFLGNFHRLRKEVEEILMRDFGLKRRRYEVALMENGYGKRRQQIDSVGRNGADGILAERHYAVLCTEHGRVHVRRKDEACEGRGRRTGS